MEQVRQKGKGPGHRGKVEKILRILCSVFLLLVILGTAVIEILTLTEYRPQEREILAVDHYGWDPIGTGESIKVLTWNCGYGALGDNADYFLDGGRGVRTADDERVRSNLDGIIEASAGMEPDVIFYQEVDERAARSCRINEVIRIANGFIARYNSIYSTAYAYNLIVRYIPYPVPPIGDVRSGLMSLTGFRTDEAERIALPCPFNWPLRLTDYKKCLLLERLPLENSEKELVLINLHMDAFDSDEAKTEQTQALVQIMREEVEKGNYVIAGGDFDQTFNNVDLSAYPLQDGVWKPGEIDTAQFGEDFLCLMDGSTPTCRSLDKPYAGADPESFQYYVIDGFIVSSNIDVRLCETRDLGFVYSDHNPVLMECSLRP